MIRSTREHAARRQNVTFRNILVAVDGSADAELALTHAIELATCGHSRLTLFTAIARPPPFAYWGLAATGMIGFFDDAESEAERIASHARERVPDHISVAGVVTRQPVQQALIHQIVDGHHDLVVMGSHGAGPIHLAVLGSVSRYALRHSPVPVVIVHADAFAEDTSAGSIPAQEAPELHHPRTGSKAA